MHALTKVLRHVPKTIDDSDLQPAMMPFWDEFEINRVRLRHPPGRVMYFRRRLLLRLEADHRGMAAKPASPVGSSGA